MPIPNATRRQVMRHPGGDKIVIARGEDDHWIYFSVRDDTDNGSIIDFIQHQRRCSIGEVHRELRPWVGGSFVRPVPGLFVPEVVAVSQDRAGGIRALAGMRSLVTHRYLEEERGIPRSVHELPRFAGRVLVDARSNVLFPHADRDGPCGYEVKNRGFTGFAPGGRRGCGSRVRCAPILPWCWPRAASTPSATRPCTPTTTPATPASGVP